MARDPEARDAEARDLKAIVRRTWEEIWPNGDVNGLLEVVHPETVNHETPPGFSAGLDGLQRIMLMMKEAFSDQRFDIHEIIAEGETIAVHLTHSGRHTGAFLGMAPTNREFAYRHMHFLRFQDGKAIEHWAVRDDATFMRQLGVLPDRADRGEVAPVS